VVLNIDEDIMLLRGFEKLLMMVEKLDGRFGDEDMDASLDCIQCYGIVRGIGSEDCDYAISVLLCVGIRRLTGAAFRKCVNCLLVSVGIALSLLGILVELGVQPIVCLRNVLLQVLPCS
jgi:hypothetical protein